MRQSFARPKRQRIGKNRVRKFSHPSFRPNSLPSLNFNWRGKKTRGCFIRGISVFLECVLPMSDNMPTWLDPATTHWSIIKVCDIQLIAPTTCPTPLLSSTFLFLSLFFSIYFLKRNWKKEKNKNVAHIPKLTFFSLFFLMGKYCSIH